MNVRRYQARDMREAMRLVREHQGPDAVILSSRRVDGMLEVVAGTEPEPASRALESAPPSKPALSIPVDPELAAMRRELCDLRTLLVQQQALSERDQWAARHPLAAEFVERLMKCGFNEKLARSLAGSIQESTPTDEAWTRLRTRLSASIATAQTTVLERGGMLALVGSTGVGKTTTINRLALRHIRRMGAESVSLVTLDRQRLGAYKQLQAFGQMAGIPVMLLESERDLLTLASRAGDGKLILIDTEGRAARDVAERKLFAQVRHQIDLETWLVVPATHQASVLRQVLEAFQSCEPSALVLTKVDEAEQLGETLSVLLEQSLGLAFYSDGQRIDEDFHKADTLYLTRLALNEPASQVRPTAHRPIAEPTPKRVFEHAQVTRLQVTSQTRTEQESMVLESVVPFRKRVHAAF
ncbi:flagellar biosynthesis protein FlhF [Thiorhodococcus mannitoliphagus]|uniref:Flagellar biosynthesis protein FlhF n=1 Tax=Thiorhodococcus mannitoliphagus TaxID=329406 RepID=A0A6P1DRG8_9GAMM|nr:flagellar biosynthesis protein FlhF [Thiorhodococcus mannitoliphagus]NEX20130.1 flagellar biosynthesis protein FlhF [Thiorhodococcus mannitoliphagus]